jgi:CubicO group peptidase (beta-lactamase class C family)
MIRLLLCALLVATAANAQPDAVDQYMEAELAKRSIPGAALVVIRGGQVVKMQGYGLANVELGVAVTPDSVFELASVTKQFTATAIMLLVEEGKLRLDDPVNALLPGAPEKWKGITVRHLLTHTSGLPGLADGFKSLGEGGWRLGYTTGDMFKAAMSDPVSFAPGERYQYSDVGYFLLGMIVEKASGLRYAQFLERRFFRPLGMTATSVIDQYAIVNNRAAGYTLYQGRLVHIRRHVQFGLASHYGVLSSVRDLVKWDAALASGNVVKPSSLEQMWTPTKLRDGSSVSYGFGWEVDERRGHRRISHSGITGTEYSRYPDDDLVVIVLTNLGRWLSGTGINSWGLTHAVAGRYIDGLLISTIAAEPDHDPELLRKLREMLAAVASGADSSLMTPRLGALFSTDPASRTVLAGRLKELKSFSFVTCDRARSDAAERFGAPIARVCHYRMVTGPETRYYSFWLTPEGRVAYFRSITE